MAIYDLPESEAFLDYLDDWYESLPEVCLDEAIADAGGAESAGVFAIDVVKGFCETGPLASERVGAIVEPIAELFQAAHDRGVKHFVLPQDSHPADSPQFEQYGPHCVAGSEEAETVNDLSSLPFAESFRVMPKRSISPALGTELNDFLDDDRQLKLAICVGDCTDLCLYQLAMHLKLRSNVEHLGMRVLVPANCVDTYHLGVQHAQQVGATPHDGELLHRIFLYHMALNGVDVVRRLT